MIYREGVCCIGFTPDKEKTVLIERPDVCVWWIPGGGIEDGESEEDAAKREFREETGLEIRIEVFHGEYDMTIPKLLPFFYDKNYVYSGTIIGGEPTVNEEAGKVEYFEVDKLPRSLLYAQKQRIHEAKQGIVHAVPRVQTCKLADLVNNIHVIKKLPTLLKNLTISSPKRQ